MIDFLNQKTKSKYSPTNYTTQTLILDRIRDGAALDDFKAVIRKKTSQWLADAKMAGNLRPATLFAPDKFEGYLQEARRNGGGKQKTKKTLSGIELMALGYDVLTKFGGGRFDEFCEVNKLSTNDINAIREKADRESKAN